MVIYYDIYLGRLQLKTHDVASTCWNNAIDRFIMHTYSVYNKLVGPTVRTAGAVGPTVKRNPYIALLNVFHKMYTF